MRLKEIPPQLIYYLFIFFYLLVSVFTSMIYPLLYLICNFSTKKLCKDIFSDAHLFNRLTKSAKKQGVWIHAASDGEVEVASNIIKELLASNSELDITISCNTASGRKKALDLPFKQAKVITFPYDLVFLIFLIVSRTNISVFVSIETEFWPLILFLLKAIGVRPLLLNGRISLRSLPIYRRLYPLISNSLKRFSLFSMIGSEDAARAVALGAPPERVVVDGNAKYAGITARVAACDTGEAAARLALGDAPLLVAGSARSGEEEPVLGAFARVLKDHPSAVLAVAPRHVERAPRWLALARSRGLSAQLWSELAPSSPRRAETRVVVVDAMGQLLALYGLGRAAFVGASLAPLGGQNPVEPAAWGAPLCFGSDMADFLDAAQALRQAGGAQEVADQDELAAWWSAMLASPEKAQAQGRAAKGVSQKYGDSARAAAGHILDALERRKI